MDTVLLAIISLCGVAITILSVIKYIKNNRVSINKENHIDTDIAKLLLNTNYVEQINNLIDSMIKEQVDIYQILVLSTENDLHYIKAEDQEKLHKFVTYKVIDNISPEVRQLIGLIYNVTNDKDLESVISTRAKMYLLGFILEYNKESIEF